MIQEKIRELVNYGLLTGLVEPEDEVYTVNRLLELFDLARAVRPGRIRRAVWNVSGPFRSGEREGGGGASRHS